MDKIPPLLASFFEQERGAVLYKAYPPHRGDDVPALVELASALPPTIDFIPIRPEFDVVDDVRTLLPAILSDPVVGSGFSADMQLLSLEWKGKLTDTGSVAARPALDQLEKDTIAVAQGREQGPQSRQRLRRGNRPVILRSLKVDERIRANSFVVRLALRRSLRAGP